MGLSQNSCTQLTKGISHLIYSAIKTGGTWRKVEGAECLPRRPLLRDLLGSPVFAGGGEWPPRYHLVWVFFLPFLHLLNCLYLNTSLSWFWFSYSALSPAGQRQLSDLLSECLAAGLGQPISEKRGNPAREVNIFWCCPWFTFSFISQDI